MTESKNGKNGDMVLKQVKGLLAQDPTFSQNALAAKIGVHYTVVAKAVEKLKELGELPEIPMPEPKVELPIPQSILNINIKTDEDCIRIIPLGDIHIGAQEGVVDWEKLKGTIDYILSKKNTYVIGMGDYIDGSIHGLSAVTAHPSPFEAMYNLTEQVAVFWDEVLTPLAKADRILGIAPGHHDQWMNRDRGQDIDALLCKFISKETGHVVPYLSDGFFMNIKLSRAWPHNGNGKQLYSIYGKHGFGGTKTAGGRRSVVERQFANIMADVKLSGHHHQIDTWKSDMMIDGVMKKGYIGMTGTFMKFRGTYAESWGLAPNVTGVIKVKLFAEKHDVHISI